MHEPVAKSASSPLTVDPRLLPFTPPLRQTVRTFRMLLVSIAPRAHRKISPLLPHPKVRREEGIWLGLEALHVNLEALRQEEAIEDQVRRHAIYTITRNLLMSKPLSLNDARGIKRYLKS